MTLSFILSLLAGVIGILGAFGPPTWLGRATIAAIVLLAIVGMLLSGGLSLE